MIRLVRMKFDADAEALDAEINIRARRAPYSHHIRDVFLTVHASEQRARVRPSAKLRHRVLRRHPSPFRRQRARHGVRSLSPSPTLAVRFASRSPRTTASVQLTARSRRERALHAPTYARSPLSTLAPSRPTPHLGFKRRKERWNLHFGH